MGCDIHMYREKFVNNHWLSADVWEDAYGEGQDVAWEGRFTDRNYNLFSVLAGVRTRELCGLEQEPRGLPFDVCDKIRARYDSADDHTPSFLFLHELKALRRAADGTTFPVSGMKDKYELEKLKDSIARGSPDWDLLYPYCQATNHLAYVNFKIDVPASFIIGDALSKIIAMFDSMDGENHRIVFWFDN